MNKTLALVALAAFAATASAQYSLTILHNNDGESRLLPGPNGVGGVAEFKTLVDTTRDFYRGLDHGVVTISSGDNFLPGQNFQASLNSGPLGARTYFDAIAIREIGYDAVVIGNHDFDAGPAVLADFIAQTGATPYLGANLDFSAEPALQQLVDLGRIAPATIATVQTANGPKSVGIVGAATQQLPFLSSLGGVTVSDVAAAINATIAGISGSVDHIIVASHLQSISEDFQLAGQIVDPAGKVALLIAGGGDELLAPAPGSPSPVEVYGPSAPVSVVNTGFAPGTPAPDGVYPATASTGVPVVTTPGEYGTLGRITLNIDAAGVVTVDGSSNLQLNRGFDPHPILNSEVVHPVQQFVSSLNSTVIAQTSQFLPGNGQRNVIRANEAALGNLLADAFLSVATAAAPGFGLDSPVLAVANGGGVRADVPAGPVSLGTTFAVSPFGNVLSIVEDVTRDDLKLIFENAYGQVGDSVALPGVNPIQAGPSTGRFLHVSEGVEVVYNILATPLRLNNDGNLVTPGSRIVDLTIQGETIVADGVVVPGAPIDLAIVDFLAGGGDQIFEDYLSQRYAFTRIGVTDQQALESYVRGLSGGNTSFDIASDARYDNVADGRIVAIPEPACVLIAALAVCGLAARRV